MFVNAGYKTENGIRNTTHAIDRNGNIVGGHFKAHPVPSEVKTDAEGGHELDVAYSYEFDSLYILELEGLRFAFLTCYDFYFYENFAKIARENVDIIIGCSLQRTDSHEALSVINKFLCYNTNAHLIRASVSLGESCAKCGCSMVVSPKGEVLVNMGSPSDSVFARLTRTISITSPQDIWVSRRHITNISKRGVVLGFIATAARPLSFMTT